MIWWFGVEELRRLRRLVPIDVRRSSEASKVLRMCLPCAIVHCRWLWRLLPFKGSRRLSMHSQRWRLPVVLQPLPRRRPKGRVRIPAAAAAAAAAKESPQHLLKMLPMPFRFRLGSWMTGGVLSFPEPLLWWMRNFVTLSRFVNQRKYYVYLVFILDYRFEILLII